MWKNHFDVYVILHHSLRNGLVWTGKRRTFKTWTIVKFQLFKTNRLTFGIRNSGSEETDFLPTSFLDLIKLYFGFWGMRISQKLERTEVLFVIFLVLVSILFSFSLSSLFPSFLYIWFCCPLYRLSFLYNYGWLVFFLMRIRSIRISRLKIEKFKEFLKNNFEKDIIGHDILC